MSNILKGIVNEVDPRNFDSDIDYYNALKHKPRKPSVDDYDDSDLEKYDDEPIQRQPAQGSRPEYNISKDEDRDAGYNMTVTVKAPTTQQAEWELKSYIDHNWGAKKQVGKITPIKDGVVQVHMIDNHKYGMWKPWKDEPPIAEPISFTESIARPVNMLTEAKTFRLWESAGYKLVEAQLTADQINQIFQYVQNVQTAGGDNRTMLGKGKDAAGAVSKAWEDLKTKVQNSGPIQNVDAMYDKAAEQLKQATGGDQGVMQYVQKYRDFAKKHPVAQSLIYSALIAAAGISGAGVGGAAALGLFKMVDKLLQGEKFSSAAYQGTKTGAMAYGASKIGDAIRGAQQHAAVSGEKVLPVQGSGEMEYVPRRGTIQAGQGAGNTVDWGGEFVPKGAVDVPSGNLSPDYTQRVPPKIDPDQFAKMANDTVVAPTGDETNYADSKTNPLARANAKVDADVDKINAAQQAKYDAEVKDVDAYNAQVDATNAKNMADYQQRMNSIPANQAGIAYDDNGKLLPGWIKDPDNPGFLKYDAAAASNSPKLSESKKLSESQIYLVIGKIVERQRLQEGIMDTLKGAAGKVGNYVATKGQNLTTKITADKLLQAWKKAGSPTDSLDVASLIQKAGVPTSTITQVFNNMKIPAPGQPGGGSSIERKIDVDPSSVAPPNATPTAQEPANTTPTSTPTTPPSSQVAPAATKNLNTVYAQTRKLIDQLDSRSKQRVVAALKKDLQLAEGEAEYGPEWDEKVERVGKLAKEGPRKTVWDPVKRVYKTVPVNPPKEKGVAEGEPSPMFKDAQRADRIRSLKNLIPKYEEKAIAANRAGDDAKTKQYQQVVQKYKQELGKLAKEGVAEGEGGNYYSIALQMYPQLKQFDRATVITALNNAYEDYLMHYGYEGIGPDEERSMINRAIKGLKQGVAEGLPQTLRKVVPGYAKREIDKKMDAGKFGKTDADKDANFQRYKKIQDKIKEQGVAEEQSLEESFDMKIDELAINEDWQKVNKSDKTDGMSRKAVKAYRRENPGSKLKTAVTKKPSKLKKGSKDAKRRKSFCARMSGMKKSRASAKTKRDPNSPINKALRRWNCESVEQLHELMMIAEQKVAEAKNAKQQAAIAIAKKQAKK
jgi:hypothetical protein